MATYRRSVALSRQLQRLPAVAALSSSAGGGSDEKALTLVARNLLVDTLSMARAHPPLHTALTTAPAAAFDAGGRWAASAAAARARPRCGPHPTRTHLPPTGRPRR